MFEEFTLWIICNKIYSPSGYLDTRCVFTITNHVHIISCQLWLGFEEGTYAEEFLRGILTPRKLQFVQVVFGRGIVTLSNPGVKIRSPLWMPQLLLLSWLPMYPRISQRLRWSTDESWRYEAVGLAVILQRLRGTIPSISARFSLLPLLSIDSTCLSVFICSSTPAGLWW